MRYQRPVWPGIMLWLLFCIYAGVLSCTLKNRNMNDQKETAIKAAIRDMLAESRTYFMTDALKSRTRLAALLEDHIPDEKRFTPIELFFMAETSPDAKAAIDDPALQQAYCAALEQLPADWWGLPGNTRVNVAANLLAVPGIEQCLKTLLSNNTALSYLDGESNTLAKELQWQRGDLAAGLLAALYDEEFDFRAPPDERMEERAALRER